MRFLIDECLSIDLVSVASGVGHEAQHVAHVGKAGWKDWNVVRYASDGDFVLVTNNASVPNYPETTRPDLILGGSCLVRQKLDRGRLFPEVTRPARGSFGNFRVT